jgi:hypothetical protein
LECQGSLFHRDSSTEGPRRGPGRSSAQQYRRSRTQDRRDGLR